MVLEPIDFQGRFVFDEALARKLQMYLDEKESHLCNKLIQALFFAVGDPLVPVLPPPSTPGLNLSNAIQVIAEKINAKNFQRIPQDDWKRVGALWQNALWEYAETIQGCTTELFQQLQQIGFEHWKKELATVLQSLKQLLLRKLQELSASISQLDRLINQYQEQLETAAGSKWEWLKSLFNWRPGLDKTLISSLAKTENELKTFHQRFIHQHEEYQKLCVKIDEALKKFKNYQALAKLNFSEQEEFRTLYRLLKTWEKNLRTKTLSEEETVQAVKNILNPEKAITIFKDYYHELVSALYERSILIKKSGLNDSVERDLLLEVIKGYRAETLTLGVIVAKYREFLLRTDPDPYVRSRWGFAEWIVGQEPPNAKQLLSLSYEIEGLDQLFEKFYQSVQKGPLYLEEFNTAKLSQDIEKIIHEMGQPLTSRQLMRFHGEQLLKLLEQLDELGSFSPTIIDVVGKYLSQALRADWQFNVLHEFPLYRRLYTIHHGLIQRQEDRLHRHRLGIFKKIIRHLEHLIKSRQTQKHSLEIDLDINDMKGYLQDFFASVQRLEKEELPLQHLQLKIKEIEIQLLEYRDLFGNFFNQLPKNDGKLLRNAFLFVDQYFEAIENRIQDLKNRPIQEI